ncbi:MAG: BON domain-containing protein [Alphaproteobacteria bacterium]
MIRTSFHLPLLLLVGALSLSACAGVVVGGAATVGVAAVQERSVGDAVDDASIEFRVKDKFLEQSDKLFTRVSVDSVEGRVLLSGTVESPDDRVDVARMTWQVEGVKEVFNEVEVRDRGGLIDYFKDVRIANELRLKMLTDKEISALNYSVETVNSVIYLMGIAQNQPELERVTGHASNIKGVERVVSFVVLKDDPRRGS